MNKVKNPNRFGAVFSTIFYIAAGVIFVFGVVLLIVFINMANSVVNSNIYFQMLGIGELAKVILRPLQAGLINLGIIVFIILLVLSVVFASAGWIIRRQSSLFARITVLEEKVELDSSNPKRVGE